MPDPSKLNIQKAIDQGSRMASLSSLANSGVRNVKVLDENTLHELIAQAIDEVVSSQTSAERSKLLADARKQLVQIMNERNEFMDKAGLAEAGKNDLVQQVEHLQNELKVRREIEQKGDATQARLKELEEENAWLRGEHDTMVEALDQAQSEIKRLRAELEALRAQLEGAQALADQAAAAAGELETLKEELAREQERADQAGSAAAELEASQAEAETLREQLAREQTRADQAEAARAEAETLQEELAREQSRADQAGASAEALRRDLEAVKAEAETARAEIAALLGFAEEARRGEETADDARAPIEQELRKAREENALLEAKLAEQLEAVRAAAESTGERQAALQAERNRSQEEADRLRQENDRLVREVGAARTARPPTPPPPPPLEEVREDIEEVADVEPAPPVPLVIIPSDRRHRAGGKGKGLDIGTVNLVAAEQNEKGEVELRTKRNVFLDIGIDAYTKAMLTRLNVPYFIQNKKMYILGEEAFELANVLNKNTRRPMKDGLISPKEQDALPVMKLLIGSILGEPRTVNEVCFYSVPGDPVDSDLSVAYHRDLFDAVLQALGYKPSHIIEGHAVTFAELGDEDFTGIGVSCGGGMFNVCVAYKSMPALTFSTSRSGDWVDQNVAQALSLKPAKATLLKEKGVDLLHPKTREEDAISIYYRNLIQYNLNSIAERFRAAENMPTFSEPVSMVFSGGTSMAGNFIELVREVFKGLDFPIPVKEVRMAKDPFNATAKGALVAAQLEMAQSPA